MSLDNESRIVSILYPELDAIRANGVGKPISLAVCNACKALESPLKSNSFVHLIWGILYAADSAKLRLAVNGIFLLFKS